jgi:hypothetical protein
MTVDTKIQYSRMGARLLGHVQNGTTDWAADTMEVPSTEYTDPCYLAAGDGRYLQISADFGGGVARNS